MLAAVSAAARSEETVGAGELAVVIGVAGDVVGDGDDLVLALAV